MSENNAITTTPVVSVTTALNLKLLERLASKLEKNEMWKT